VGSCGLATTSATAQRRWPTLSIEAGVHAPTLVTHEVTTASETIRYTTGLGFDAGGRLSYRFLSVGVGFEQAGYSVERDSARTTMRGITFSPRISLPAIRRVHPFIEGDVGRLGETTHGLTVIGPLRLDDRVNTLGGRGGFTIRFASALSIDLSATYSYLSFHDFTIDDVPFNASKPDEHTIDARLGVSYRLRQR
jgi:hypothetical protein